MNGFQGHSKQKQLDTKEYTAMILSICEIL